MGSLIILSNRLPISVRRVNNKLEFYPSVGGLATGLASYTTKSGSKWIGWPGLPSDDLTDSERTQISRELKRHHCYPVFLTQKQLDEYYNGYSNSVLWPLFHHLDVKSGDTMKNWQAYQTVNALFAGEALALSGAGSTIWVHDYQLLLVPKLLRHERPNDNIGFFLHIPFPPAKIFDRLSTSVDLVQGMLGANLIGFHTASYTNNFMASCQLFGVGITEDKRLILPSRVVQVTEFPMGIDYAKFTRATKHRAVQAKYRKLVRKYHGQKVIITVDRLDPTKGLVERLEAYAKLLKDSPKLHSKVTMIMLAVPSRTDIGEYKKLKVQVDDLVKRINQDFGNTHWQPVNYLYKTLSFEKLTALYQRADIAFIAPIRDGMNLVAKEYLASRSNHDGALILSQTAGAAEELKEAIMVDPAQPATLVEGLKKALDMPKRELKRRTKIMQQYLAESTVQTWADNFIDSLQKPITPLGFITRKLTDKRITELKASYNLAKHRLLLLDYDGVLAPIINDPEAAQPTPRVLRLLKSLGSDANNEVVLISGRAKENLETWFKDVPVALAAEHGALFKRYGAQQWHKTTTSDSSWQKQIIPILEEFSARTPGTFIETKDLSLVWHYRNASPYYSQKHLVQLKRLLRPIAVNENLSLRDGHKVLGIRPLDVSKARAAQEWLIHNHDFVLCMGDDSTDEDLFAVLPPEAYSIKIGNGHTKAHFRLPGVREVLDLLSKL